MGRDGLGDALAFSPFGDVSIGLLFGGHERIRSSVDGSGGSELQFGLLQESEQ